MGLRHGELPAVVGHTAAAAVVVVAADMVEAMATQAVPAVHHLGGKRPSPLHHLRTNFPYVSAWFFRISSTLALSGE